MARLEGERPATLQARVARALPVLDDGNRVIGFVHLHDLMRAGAL